MNNRYLYKAKRTDNGEWIQGFLFNDNFPESKHYFVGGIIVTEYTGTACDKWNIAGIDFGEIDPSTICQCTGLKDKSGKLIWENDIVKDDKGNLYKAFWRNKYYQFSWICIKSNCLPIEAKWDLWSFKSYEIEIIGNIFDNSQLLEVMQDGSKIVEGDEVNVTFDGGGGDIWLSTYMQEPIGKCNITVKKKEEETMMTVGDLRKTIKDLDDNVEIGIMESYDPETDVAEYSECQELALLPEQAAGDVLIFSTQKTGIVTENETQEEL